MFHLFRFSKILLVLIDLIIKLKYIGFEISLALCLFFINNQRWNFSNQLKLYSYFFFHNYAKWNIILIFKNWMISLLKKLINCLNCLYIQVTCPVELQWDLHISLSLLVSKRCFFLRRLFYWDRFFLDCFTKIENMSAKFDEIWLVVLYFSAQQLYWHQSDVHI